MTRVALSRVHFPVTSLGPGRRVAVWVQGCSIRCPGCVSLDTWASRPPETEVTTLLDGLQTIAAGADGLTVSGGEPFDQPDALHALLLGWRSRYSGTVLVYSGHAYEALAPRLVAWRGLIDALITDPLRLDVPQTLPLRGSDNQRLHLLTEVGRTAFAGWERPRPAAPLTLDVMVDAEAGTVWLAGIPRRGDMTRLAEQLAAAGHRLAVTEDKSASACQ